MQPFYLKDFQACLEDFTLHILFPSRIVLFCDSIPISLNSVPFPTYADLFCNLFDITIIFSINFYRFNAITFSIFNFTSSVTNVWLTLPNCSLSYSILFSYSFCDAL